MNIEILPSKDGKKTCKINSVYLHSAYGPLKESERFVLSVQAPFKPEIIFIIEPALSYCLKNLKGRFPNSKIAAIRLTKGFEEFNPGFDFVYNTWEYESESHLFSELYNRFGENILAYSLLLTWEPSAKIFSKETLSLYKAYKEIIEKCHSVLRTRSFFEKRWIKNALNISLGVNQTGRLSKKGNCPVLICASGPSLKKAIPYIKEKKPYIIAVSSALRPLTDSGIIPELVISTDGGYWAKKHLDPLKDCSSKLVLAVEGNCPHFLLRKKDVIPLIYSDGIESDIFVKSGHTFMTGLRCGTVSGTALEFAKQISNGPIYFAGLDLYISSGFQHTQNNNLELLNCYKDFRLTTKEKRFCSQSFSNQKVSLKIYEDWFRGLTKLAEKVYRIIDEPKNNLGNIKDIKTKEILNIDFTGERPEFSFSNTKCDSNTLKSFIKETGNTENWLKNVFTAEYLNYTHTYDENVKENLYSKITKSNSDFLEQLCKVFTKK